MQYLSIHRDTTLTDLASVVGRANVDEILVTNRLKRTKYIGKVYYSQCADIQATSPEVTVKQKIALLNTLTSDREVFENASLMGDNEWKVFSVLGCLPNTVYIPSTYSIPDSSEVIGGSGKNVAPLIYKKTITCLQNYGYIDPAIFDAYSISGKRSFIDSRSLKSALHQTTLQTFSGFNLPWGKITMVATLTGESIDFPVYPEELADSFAANYTSMPDVIYQYEPWLTYTSSGPRSTQLTFHFHRDMWTGDHRDGCANELIRFCEACCYPEYSGSAVYASQVRFYINGSLFISGILTNVVPEWSGPIGLDGFYLDCVLSLSITEVADSPRTFSSMRNLNIIGG